MILLGVAVNVVAIVCGTLLGQIFTHIQDEMKETVLKVIGICVIVLGMDMAFASEYFLVILFSLVLGAVVGEWFRLEDKLEQIGQWIEAKLGQNRGNVAQAFVMTTLIYCIGAMAVVGSLDSGLRLDHTILYTKSFLDGFTAIIFSSTMGIGVVFSAIPVLLYQGSIVLLSAQIQSWFNQGLIEHVIADLTSTGGILIIALGLNIIGLTKIRVGNLLPALIIVFGLSGLVYAFI